MRLQVAMIAVLLAAAVAQLGLAMRGAMHDPPVPPLYTGPATTTGQPPASPNAPATAFNAQPPAVDNPEPAASGEPEIARPDPANILRLSIGDGTLKPGRMQGEAGTSLQLMVHNQGAKTCSVVVSDAAAHVVARTSPIASGATETIMVTGAKGRYRVHVENGDGTAELTLE